MSSTTLNYRSIETSDKLQSLISKLSQNVTTYDHLLYTEHELSESTPFEQVEQYYENITNLQTKSQDDIKYIRDNFKSIYDQLQSNEFNSNTKTFLAGKIKMLKKEFEETLNRFCVMQQNFIQSHKSKIFDLERQLVFIDESCEADTRKKIDLYQFCSNYCDCNLEEIRSVIQWLNEVLVLNTFDQQLSYESVDISVTNTSRQFTQPTSNYETIESLTRKQHLLMVMIVSVTLTMFITAFLIK